jgi:integrase
MTVPRPKRGQNEGSIHKRPDGRWVAVVSLGYRDGKRARKYLYGATRREVQEKLTKTLRDQQQGLPIVPDRQTVAEFVEHWLESVARHRIRATTHATYASIIRNHIVPSIGGVRLSRLTPQQVSSLYESLLAKGLAPRSVMYVHAVLRSALKQAVRWNLLVRNPVEAVDPPRAGRSSAQVLSPEQVTQFLEAAKGDDLQALYVLALTTGMRQGELLGLMWSDVELDTAQIRVQRQLTRTVNGLDFAEPKTAKGRRTVTLPHIAVDALRQHRAKQAEARLLAGSEWTDIDLVFANQHGRPMERQNVVKRSFQPLLAAAGLPRVRFHDLRHSAATLLLSQDVHPKVVQERLGHSTISVTMDIYSHVMPSMQRDAADKLDAMFGGA